MKPEAAQVKSKAVALNANNAAAWRDFDNVKDLTTKIKPRSTRLIFKPEVIERTGVSFPTLWAWMREGKFPRSRVLGKKVCWIEAEVEAWMRALPIRTLKGDAEAV
jgi:prophage regulatory protein